MTTDAQRDDGVWWRIGFAAVLAGQAMAFSLGVNITPPEGNAYVVVHSLLAASALVVLLLLGGPLLRNTLESLRDRELTVELLFVASLGGALTASVFSSLTRSGYVFYEVVAIVLVVYTLGATLRRRSREDALAALATVRERFDACLVERDGGALERVPVAGLAPDARVVVPAGGVIAVDGVIAEGLGSVDESSMTGEPIPVVRRAGDRVWAGTVLLDGRIRVVVEAAGAGRKLDGILAAVEQARLAPSRLQREADRLIAWFLPLVCGIAVATFAAWWWARSWDVGLFNAMAVLLVACPCALGMATPVAVWRGLARLAELGFVPRGADILDALGRVDTVIFDKTGTLTEDVPTVTDFVVLERFASRRAWLRDVAGRLEDGIEHPVARALVRWSTAEGSGAAGRVRIDELRLVPGAGVEALLSAGAVAAARVALGERSLLGGGHRKEEEELRAAVKSGPRTRLVWCGVDGVPVGLIAVEEAPRGVTATAVARLRALGLRLSVLTGDAGAPPEFAGLPVRAGAAPLDKQRLVLDERSHGRCVLFVGDGLNDAAAMAAADGSVAIAGGAELTRRAAQATLPGARLDSLAGGVALGRSVAQGIRTNLRFAALYNLVGVGLAAAGQLHPVVAAVLMLVSSVVVATRAVRSVRGWSA